MKLTGIIVLLLFVFGVVVAMGIVATNSRFIAEMELGVLWLRQAAGTFLASVAALAILIRCLNGKSLAEVTGLLVALLAALSVMAPQWSTTIPLGLVVIGFIVKETIGMFPSSKSES